MIFVLDPVDRKIVMDIKQGKMDYKDVSKLLEDYLVLLEKACDTSTLPKEVDPYEIRELTLQLHMFAVQGDLNEFF